MGISCFQLNIFALQQDKTRKNRELMAKSDEQSAAAAKYAKLQSQNPNSWWKDTDIKLLQAEVDKLDEERKKFETQLKDIEARLEALEKQRDKNLKDGIPQLA